MRESRNGAGKCAASIVSKVPLTLDYTPGCTVQKGVQAMQIGIVAKKIGLSVDAIRFYERNALLRRPSRSQYFIGFLNTFSLSVHKNVHKISGCAL
jgi:MerR-like DNA binding protein